MEAGLPIAGCEEPGKTTAFYTHVPEILPRNGLVHASDIVRIVGIIDTCIGTGYKAHIAANFVVVCRLTDIVGYFLREASESSASTWRQASDPVRCTTGPTPYIPVTRDVISVYLRCW